MPSISSSCLTRIFLPNGRASDPAIAEMYRSFGLNDVDISILSSAIPKQDYYFVSAKGKQVFQLNLNDTFFEYYKTKIDSE